MQVYVQCALDVWTVVDIYGMWIIGPWLLLGVLLILWSVYSFRCHSAVRMMSKVASFVLVCSGPLSVLPGNIVGVGNCKEDVSDSLVTKSDILCLFSLSVGIGAPLKTPVLTCVQKPSVPSGHCLKKKGTLETKRI